MRLDALPLPLCPQAVRALSAGRLGGIQRVLLATLRGVLEGGTLLEGVADGTVEGWGARQALADALKSVRVPEWDAAADGHDRRWLVEKALRMYGVEVAR